MDITNDVFENRINDIAPKFCHGQNVDIISGFYRNNRGKVTGYVLRENNMVSYHVDITVLGIILLINEIDLRESRSDKSFLSKIFSRN